MSPWNKRHQPALPNRVWCFRLEPQGLRFSLVVARDCGAGVEGTDIKVVKGEAAGFNVGLDLGNRGCWEV